MKKKISVIVSVLVFVCSITLAHADTYTVQDLSSSSGGNVSWLQEKLPRGKEVTIEGTVTMVEPSDITNSSVVYLQSSVVAAQELEHNSSGVPEYGVQNGEISVAVQMPSHQAATYVIGHKAKIHVKIDKVLPQIAIGYNEYNTPILGTGILATAS